MLNKIIQKSLVGMIMSLSLSIGLHDTNLDKVAVLVATPPSVNNAADSVHVSVHLHTHAEKTSIKEAAQEKNPNPARNVRFRERKHLKNKHHQNGGRMTPVTMPV